MSLRTAAQQALEALEQIRTPLRINTALDAYDVSRAIAALRTALAEPEQEPVAELRKRTDLRGGCYVHWLAYKAVEVGSKLYAHPPQRKPLTDEEIVDLWADVSIDYDDQINIIEMARAIERAHGIGGEA